MHEHMPVLEDLPVDLFPPNVRQNLSYPDIWSEVVSRKEFTGLTPQDLIQVKDEFKILKPQFIKAVSDLNMLNHVGTADPSTNLEDRISKLKEAEKETREAKLKLRDEKGKTKDIELQINTKVDILRKAHDRLETRGKAIDALRENVKLKQLKLATIQKENEEKRTHVESKTNLSLTDLSQCELILKQQTETIQGLNSTKSKLEDSIMDCRVQMDAMKAKLQTENEKLEALQKDEKRLRSIRDQTKAKNISNWYKTMNDCYKFFSDVEILQATEHKIELSILQSHRLTVTAPPHEDLVQIELFPNNLSTLDFTTPRTKADIFPLIRQTRYCIEHKRKLDQDFLALSKEYKIELEALSSTLTVTFPIGVQATIQLGDHYSQMKMKLTKLSGISGWQTEELLHLQKSLNEGREYVQGLETLVRQIELGLQKLLAMP